MRLIRTTTLLAVLAALLLLTLDGAYAQDDKAFIEYRQKIMQSQLANIGAIGDIMKHNLPFAKNVAMHAEAIHATSQLIPIAFEKKVTAGDTDAKPDIWSDYSGFKEKAKALQEESEKLAQVAKSGDRDAIGAQLKKVGGACGACHKEYRKPKEESYKMKMQK
jgi:cytochrome c556